MPLDERPSRGAGDADDLQQGIFWRSGERPPPCLRLVLLDIAPHATAPQAHDALAHVHDVLAALPQGTVRDLAGQPERTAAESARQFTGLQTLVAFGRRLFDAGLHDPVLTQQPRPDFLSYLPAPPEPAFPALPWTPDAARRTIGETDVLVQLTADREAAVNAAAVEIWKAVVDNDLPLTLRASYAGFGRLDGRGWLEFHDGVSNLQVDDRRAAIVAGADPPWMAGGTYLAFLLLGVDLAAWRSLGRTDQELLVGRDKLSGAPLSGVRRSLSGALEPVAADAPTKAGSSLSIDHIDPPQVTDPVIEASHIHRANQNRASAATAGGLRIFRRGYDFLDALGPDGPSLGLTFISFQRDLSILQHLLHLPGWLGDVNFGGRADRQAGEPAPPALISLLAGGLYAVPPRGGAFPGAELFGQ